MVITRSMQRLLDPANVQNGAEEALMQGQIPPPDAQRTRSEKTVITEARPRFKQISAPEVVAKRLSMAEPNR